MKLYNGLFYYPGLAYQVSQSPLQVYHDSSPESFVFFSLEPEEGDDAAGPAQASQTERSLKLVLNALRPEADAAREYIKNRLYSGAVMSFHSPLSTHPYTRSPSPPLQVSLASLTTESSSSASAEQQQTPSQSQPMPTPTPQRARSHGFNRARSEPPFTPARDLTTTNTVAAAVQSSPVSGPTPKDFLTYDDDDNSCASPDPNSDPESPAPAAARNSLSHLSLTVLTPWPGTLPPEREPGAGIVVYDDVGDPVVSGFRMRVERRVWALENERNGNGGGGGG